MYQLIVCPVGPFGHAVADRLRELRDDVHITNEVDVDDGPPGSRLRLLAAWRRTPALEQAFDEESFRSGRPWLPVTLDHPALEIGPLVVPGFGACHGCYRRRIAQHDPAGAVSSAVGRHYDEHADAGPAGYLPSTALLAAAAAAEMVDRLRVAPEAEAGRVLQIDVPTQRLRSGRAVGVHGCRRCGLGRDETTRSYERLPALLQGVWG
jgi:bacteriocin biosynthesis cyclodehydratase domain-containing protein